MRERLEDIARHQWGSDFERWEVVTGSRLYNIDGDITLKAASKQLAEMQESMI